ncbi:MAG: hypothetical protein IPO09_15680 [Anaeromyxobacter sp.]|nr:hypothetical protein [Anaeromyxobacter sp.]
MQAASPSAGRAAAGDAATAAAAVRGLTGGKKEPAPASREPPVPPTLTGKALAEELRRSAGGRATDQEALAAERARLDRLTKEIAEARAALKAETGRLEALVTQAAEAQARAAKGAKPRPGQKGPAAPFEALAKTMKSMKADQAAALLTRLDRPLAATLLAGMKPAEAAAVLEKMDSATSASLVTLLAKKESP